MKLKELFQDPRKWTQGAYARDSEGNAVISTHHEACSFCIVGALNHCCGPERETSYQKLVREIKHIPQWNDAPERTHAEVLELVTRLDV